MGYLNDILTDDAAAFVDTDVFGEAVTYNPVGLPGVSINAVIVRDPPMEREGAPNARRPKMLAFIRNHATLGRTAIDTGGDTITVAYRLGGTARKFSVTGPVTHDNGIWQLELS